MGTHLQKVRDNYMNPLFLDLACIARQAIPHLSERKGAAYALKDQDGDIWSAIDDEIPSLMKYVGAKRKDDGFWIPPENVEMFLFTIYNRMRARRQVS